MFLVGEALAMADLADSLRDTLGAAALGVLSLGEAALAFSSCSSWEAVISLALASLYSAASFLEASEAATYLAISSFWSL